MSQLSPLSKAVTDFKALRAAIDHVNKLLKASTTDPMVSRHHLNILVNAAEGLVEDAKLALKEVK